MRKQPSQQDDEIEVNMTPMLDIVFIMLIFFIVTAVFVKTPGVDVVRPEANNAQAVKRVSTLIGIAKDNSIWINKKQVELEDLRYIVAKLKQENPKGKVVIKADADSNAGLVVAIVEQLNQIGIAGVAIATREGAQQ
ncbi:MAG: biopolymer transporter ExbD [Alteromonadaceae bacterium]|nr:MAG: biopolymer transporter ExbD [Alteromonadaceae bacterium]